MSLETSKQILKIFGIIGIVAGILAIIFGAMAMAGGGLIAQDVDPNNANQATAMGFIMIGSVIFLVSGIISLIEGICSVRAAKDSSKIKPAWIFAILGMVSGVVNLISNFGNGASSIFSGLLSLAVAVVTFLAANTIKNSVH